MSSHLHREQRDYPAGSMWWVRRSSEPGVRAALPYCGIQISDLPHVVHSSSEGEHPPYTIFHTMTRLAQQCDGIHPAEDVLHKRLSVVALVRTDRHSLRHCFDEHFHHVE